MVEINLRYQLISRLYTFTGGGGVTYSCDKKMTSVSTQNHQVQWRMIIIFIVNDQTKSGPVKHTTCTIFELNFLDFIGPIEIWARMQTIWGKMQHTHFCVVALRRF